MVKKLQKMAEKKAAAAGGLLDSELAATVRDSAQQIWLAGLGAFSKAQEQGGKVFAALVKEGVTLQHKTQNAAEERIGEVASKMSSMASEIGGKASQQWDKLETIFEERVAKALGRLGMPSAQEVEALMQRVEALSAAVDRLAKGGAAKPAARKRSAAQADGKAAAPKAAKAAARPAAKRATRKSAA